MCCYHWIFTLKSVRNAVFCHIIHIITCYHCGWLLWHSDTRSELRSINVSVLLKCSYVMPCHTDWSMFARRWCCHVEFMISFDCFSLYAFSHSGFTHMHTFIFFVLSAVYGCIFIQHNTFFTDSRLKNYSTFPMFPHPKHYQSSSVAWWWKLLLYHLSLEVFRSSMVLPFLCFIQVDDQLQSLFILCRMLGFFRINLWCGLRRRNWRDVAFL